MLDIVETYLELNDEEAERYAAKLASEDENQEVRTMALSWSEKIEAKAYERGVQQGLRQMIRMLQHQLERRFGPLPQTALERLSAIGDPITLEQLGRKLIDARSLEELGLVV
ncbi:MAG: hypothetical protein HC897_01705 [Thermoanaerobaculia bacterium]|nr:hypothetical protein [Thermoanaerobaculia bacterium]